MTGFIDATKYGDGGDYATIKYDPKGISLWLDTYNGPGDYTDAATDIAVDDSGNVFVTGYSSPSPPPGSADYYTIGYDKDGGLIGYDRYDGPAGGSDKARAITVDASGNVYVTGYSEGSGTERDYATIRYNSSCNQVLVKRYNGSGNFGDEANAIAFGFAKNCYGNIYVTGYSTVSWENYATIRYAQFKCGDANCDGNVSVSDVSYLITIYSRVVLLLVRFFNLEMSIVME